MALRLRTPALKPLSCSLLPGNDTSSYGDCDDDVLCEKCGSGDHPEELLLCDKCDGGYHLSCLRSILVSVPKGSWFRPSCSNHKKLKQFPLVQTKSSNLSHSKSRDSILKLSQVGGNQKKRKRSGSLVMSKRKRKLLPFNSSEDPHKTITANAIIGNSNDSLKNKA